MCHEQVFLITLFDFGLIFSLPSGTIPPPCQSTEFQCVTSGTCIDVQRQCDGVKDCNDGSDEAKSICSGKESL